MSRNVLDLGSRSWQFGQGPRQPFSSHPRDDRAAVAEWLPARVPGDIRADLLAAGRILSLDTPAGIRDSGWVDEADWWYRTQIDAPEFGRASVLEADGVDYLSAVYLDGELLATHQGMFARQTILLPMRTGEHELAIRLWGAGALPRLPDSVARRAVRGFLQKAGLTSEYFQDRMATPKAQYSFGWDFAPRVLSTGIWDDIRVVLARGAYLEYVFAVPEPRDPHADPVAVRWRVALTVRRFDPHGDVRAEIELRELDGAPFALAGPFRLSVPDEQRITFDVPPMRRWWPWDQGEPYRYRLTVRLLDERGVCDEQEVLVGVRTVARERFTNGEPWRFTVNGRHVFLRGANWVPVDILPGTVGAEDYARLTGLATAAGINFLRIWGGGIREKRAFYDECDRRGILVSQEFPLACAFLDHYPRDPEYLSVLEAETQGIVAGLRNHPSLIAWCGGNEISPRRERLPVRTIERVLAREDGTRPWIPASPSGGDVHNWDVWHGGAPWQALADVRAPFMSEFGLQALPVEATIREMFPEGPPASLDDPRWAERKLQVDKLRRYAGPLLEGNLAAAIEVTQRTQAAGIQAGIEGCRLRREGSGSGHPCGGVAFWQWNEPWPVVSWSVVDGKGRPKAAFEMLQRSYQPLLIAAKFERRQWRAGERFRAEIWIVNDGRESLDGCTVEALLDNVCVDKWESVGAPVGSARRIGSLDVALAAPPAALELSCFHQGEAVARNRYDLLVYLPPCHPVGAWLMRRAVDLLLQ